MHASAARMDEWYLQSERDETRDRRNETRHPAHATDARLGSGTRGWLVRVALDVNVSMGGCATVGAEQRLVHGVGRERERERG